MRQLTTGWAFLTSVAAYLVIFGLGVFLAAVDVSGERAAGMLLAASATIAFAAAMVLVFVQPGTFARPGRRVGAVISALLGMLPLVALSAATLRFAGLPVGSTMPLLDWSIFVAGLGLALGAVAIAALGYRRVREQPASAASHHAGLGEPGVIAQQPVRPPGARDALRRAVDLRRAQQAADADEQPRPPTPEEDDVRVTPVDLPSIGQFRRR